MSKSEDNIQYFRPELSCTLHYWAQTRAVSASAAATGLKTSSTVEFVKTKIIKVHPVLPLILSCDEEENITLWNYELKQKLMSQTVYSFINEQQRKTAVAATPQTKRYNQRSMDRHNDELLFQPKYVSYAPRKPIDQSAKYREVYGAVKDLDFADESTITYNGSNDATPQSAEYRIFIQFDQAVAFIHLMTKKVSLVTPQILNNKAPTAIDFLTPNSCMIGCSDGGVRIWNISQSKVEKSFSIGKTDVSILKVLPFESPVEEAADYQKIRVFSLGGDGNGLFWCFTLQNGVIITGTDNAIAKLNEPISQKVSAQSVLVDRENQQLIIRVTDHKFNVWDLQDLHSIATSLKDSKRMSSGRRGSLLTFKIGGGNANPADDGMPRINCHAVLKIEKTLQQSITKVYSFALMKHLAFLSGVYAVTPKNHMIMLVHSASGGGDDSEQASAITTANEKQRLNLLLEINLQRYVNDYYQKMSGGTGFNATDHLKIYSINTSILNPHLLILATSYGPMVLSLPQLPSGPFVAYHHSWKESLITNLENYAKRLSYDVHGHDHITNSTDGVNTFSSNTAFDLDVDVVSEFRYEKNVVGEAKTNLHDKKPAPNKGVVTVGSGSNPFKEEKPIFLPSPSGDYCTLFWPTLCCYSILHIPAASSSHGSMSISADDQGSPDHSHRSIPRDSSLRGKKNLVNSLIAGGATLQEVERGSCLEFAWISFDNSFVIKTPMGQKTVVASDKNRRGSLAGFFSKQEKVSKKMVFNELLLKRIVYTTSHDVQILQLTTVEIPNPDYDPEKAATVVNTHSNTAAAVPAAPISQTLSLDVKQVVDLFSGPLVSLNYQIPSEAKSKFITNPEEIPIIESKSSLGGVYHQFFYYNEDAHKLCPVGPVMQRVLSVKWDYLNGLVAVQTVDGTIHVLKLTTDEGKGNFQSTPLIKLQTIASIQSNSLHHIPNNPWNRYFWFDGLLWFQSSPQINAQDEITNPFTLYSFWKIPSIQTKSSAANKELAYYSYETYQWHISGKKSNDWKFISGIFHGDLVNICNGMIVFSCRDGSLKALRLSDYPLLSVFLFLHQYGAAIEIGGESDITHFLPSILRNYLHALTSDEKERLKQWLLNRDMKEQLLSFPSLSQSQVNLILSSQKTD